MNETRALEDGTGADAALWEGAVFHTGSVIKKCMTSVAWEPRWSPTGLTGPFN